MMLMQREMVRGPFLNPAHPQSGGARKGPFGPTGGQCARIGAADERRAI
jgi:hypothetical protein